MDVPTMSIKATGAKIPAIGVGTFGSDHVSNEEMAQSVHTALRLGYRNIDCASVYGNEKEIGKVLNDFPVNREELWITSKLWNDMHGKGKVLASCRQSLKDLGLEYLDLYLVHWPFPNFHPPKCDVTSRSENARPYIHEEFMETWREMEELVDLGLVRHIGTSNMTKAKLTLLLQDCRIRPSFQEMELHPCFQQQEFLSYVKGEGIIPIGFCPLGSPNRPERDMTEGDAVDMEHPIVVEIAKAHHCHPANICLKWAQANGIIPIPQSTKEKNLLSNLESICSDPLSNEEVERLKGADCNSRLVKGQVFLWKEAKDWTDLWDLDGTIPCPESYKQ
ncbi:aldo/keto reductase, diketogulonate reductase [Sphaerochaeta pleomorpha str. Grapes]|uniref:Aldo/keto reductase, diketogulonate reductase n=1 Tax=Sphaerochaeta pleomorpha (strain ATCC BAA-1885 / DSM 22778 / Grapes) TaxID=158190 RepID=G8QUQ3_SPHPG|nr:aldo/keto reductase [Sphaerochaeta pleomorpha]AEV30361.1 aldo/keto reductase, diketogulonate reductase [Sphaerochaeta pleomorpha str. Grapes]